MTRPGPAAATPAVPAGPEATIAAIAARQHGVVARWQLEAAGITRAAIDWQVRRKRLHVLHRGIYRVGPLPQPRARLMTAVLLCGSTARLSHASAATLLNLLAARPSERIEVTGQCNRRVPDGVRLHRAGLLPPDELTQHDGIPVTTPARTLLDLAGSARPGDVEQALIEALRRRMTDYGRISELLDRYPARSGTRLLRQLLTRLQNPQLTRSEAERRLREIIRQSELPVPVTNTRPHGYEVDVYWPNEQVAAEVDGFAFHTSHAAFQRDRRRDADLVAAGITVVRFTWHQLQQRPLVVAARLGAILATARERSARRP